MTEKDRLQLSDRAVQSAPNRALVWFLRAFLPASLESTQAALQKACDIDPSPLHLIWLARIKATNENGSASETCYRLAMAHEAARTEKLQVEFASLLLETGKNEEAWALLNGMWTSERAKKIRHEDSLASLLCVTLWRSNRKTEASSLYLKIFQDEKRAGEFDSIETIHGDEDLNLTLAEIYAATKTAANSKNP
jgi:hypothetical protein